MICPIETQMTVFNAFIFTGSLTLFCSILSLFAIVKHIDDIHVQINTLNSDHIKLQQKYDIMLEDHKKLTQEMILLNLKFLECQEQQQQHTQMYIEHSDVSSISLSGIGEEEEEEEEEEERKDKDKEEREDKEEEREEEGEREGEIEEGIVTGKQIGRAHV